MRYIVSDNSHAQQHHYGAQWKLTKVIATRLLHPG